MKVFTINIKQKYIYLFVFNKQNIKSLLFFGVILLSLCLYTQSVFSQEMKLPRELRKTLRKADKQNKKGNYDIAMDNYLYVIEQKPFHVNSLIKYADICFKQKRDYKEALDKYERVLPLIKDEITRLENKYKQKRKTRKRIKYLKEKKIQTDNRIRSCRSYLSEEHRNKNKERENRLLGKERKKVIETNNKQQINNRTDNLVNNDHNIIDYNLSEFNSKEIKDNWSVTESDFLTGFIKINAKDNKQKLEVIKNEVENQYDNLSNNQKIFELPYYKITEINQFWLDGIKFKKYDWFENLKEKESYYRDKVEEYNSLLNEKIKLLNESEIINNEINGIRKKISITQQNKQRLDYLKENGLGEELKSRLRTIPRSILLIGRIKHDAKANEETLIKELMDEMIQEAIGQINGKNILSTFFREQEDIAQLFEISSEGIAQISNKFYKPIKISFDDGLRTYEIYRIEVFPFDEKEIHKDQISEQNNNNTAFYDIDVYGTSSGNDSILYKLPDYNKEKFDIHKFSPDEKKFIKQENKFSAILNNAYINKIDSAVKWYNKEMKYLIKKLNSNKETLNQLFNEIEIKQKDSIINIERFNEIDLKSQKNYEIEIIDAKNKYENFYKEKHQFINHLSVINTETLPTNKPYESGYKELAEKCFYEVIKNITKEYNKTTIYKEVQNNNTLIGFREDVVNYEPIIKSFRIITLGSYYEDEIKRSAILSLNIAFVIKWKPVISNDKNVSSVKPEAPKELPPEANKQKAHNEPDFKDIPFDTKVTENEIDSDTHNIPSYEWKCLGNELSSLISYNLYDKENGWHIADKDELKNIISSPKNQKRINKSFFGSNNWPNSKEEIILVTNSSKRNTVNNRVEYIAYKIQKNWRNISTIKINKGDEVYILIIKD